MNKMTSEQYEETLRQQMLEVAQRILDESTDISEGCMFLYRTLYACNEFREKVSKENYFFLMGLDDELEEFPKGKARENYSIDALKKFDEKEKETLLFHKANIVKTCRKILASDIANPPPEDPLSWPYSDDVW